MAAALIGLESLLHARGGERVRKKKSCVIWHSFLFEKEHPSWASADTYCPRLRFLATSVAEESERVITSVFEQ